MPNAPTRLPWLVSLFVLALAPGCIITETGGHGEWCEDEYHVCQDSTDCHSNQYCRHDECRDVPADAERCTSNWDCGSQQTCIDGVCCRDMKLKR